MSSPFQDQLEAALVELREQQRKIKEFGAEQATRRSTVVSKNRMVSSTVDSGGRLLEIALKGNRYRSMAPAELGALIVETVQRAQDAAAQESRALAAQLMPADAGIAALGGELDIDAMIESAIGLAGLPIFADDQSHSAPAAGAEHLDA